jgi:hypothetical protein
MRISWGLMVVANVAYGFEVFRTDESGVLRLQHHPLIDT